MTIRGVFGAANALIESSERKKQMELEAQQKVQFEQSFKDKMAEAKELEGFEQWEDALELRFALIFPPLPADATEFDFVAPKTVWMFKDIKCR